MEIGTGTAVTVTLLRPYVFGMIYLEPNLFYDMVLNPWFLVLTITIIILFMNYSKRKHKQLRSEFPLARPVTNEEVKNGGMK